MALQIRRGPTADRMSYTPVVGELIWDTSTSSLYIGNGTTAGGLPAGTLVTEDVQDIASSMLINGTHQNITFTYDDTLGRINSTFDLTTFNGTFTADGFIGSHYANDSTLLLNAVTGAVNLNGTVKGHIIPFTNITYDLGSASNRFRDLYLSGSSINLGNATITATGSAVNLPAGSTVNGVLIGSGGGDGVVEDNTYKINIAGRDSSTIINSFDNSILASSVQTASLFASTIDTVDSSTINVIPSASFNSDVTVENDLLVKNIVLNGIQHNAIGRELFPTPQAGEPDRHFVTFLNNFNGRSTVKTDGDFHYTPSSSSLECGNFVGTTSVNSPLVNTTVLKTGEIEANNILQLTTLLNIGSGRNLVQIGSNFVDGRLRLMSNTYKNLSQMVIDQYHSTVETDAFRFLRGRGTSVTPVVVNVGDEIGDIQWAAFDGSAAKLSANIFVNVAGTPSAGVMPSEMTFRTSNSAGTLVNAIRLTKDQTAEFGGAVKLAVYANATARDAAITAPTAGMMVFNTTSTKFQGYTGSAWVDLN